MLTFTILVLTLSVNLIKLPVACINFDEKVYSIIPCKIGGFFILTSLGFSTTTNLENFPKEVIKMSLLLLQSVNCFDIGLKRKKCSKY